MPNLFCCGRMLILLLIAASLVACSAGSAKGGHGKPSSSSSSSSSGKVTSSSSSSSSSSSGGETICPAIYQPVCSVAPQVVMCKTGSIFCPIGLHKTFSSECAAHAAGASTLIRAGECGELEGHSYDQPNCGVSAPVVCGTATDTAPCGTIPCPGVVYKTYSDVCELGAQRLLFPGQCGKHEGTPVTQPSQMPCTADAPGVCAKTATNIVCVTTPCPTHVYKTFANRCSADNEMATVIGDGSCDSLEGVTAGGEPPVKLVDSLPSTNTKTTISNVRFKGGVLTLSLGYSGCNAQHFDFYIGNVFLKSKPVQVNFVFKPQQEHLCAAYFTTEFSYDLLPLKQLYGAEHGEIVLPGIGSYVF